MIEWRVDCAESGPREIRSGLLHEVAPGHLHFARVRSPGSTPLERVLTNAEPGWRLAAEGDDQADTSAGSSLWSYVMIGVQHIGTGPDHLAFVLALIELSHGKLVTAQIVDAGQELRIGLPVEFLPAMTLESKSGGLFFGPMPK